MIYTKVCFLLLSLVNDGIATTWEAGNAVDAVGLQWNPLTASVVAEQALEEARTSTCGTSAQFGLKLEFKN
jgi:hypothetical protein